MPSVSLIQTDQEEYLDFEPRIELISSSGLKAASKAVKTVTKIVGKEGKDVAKGEAGK